MIFKPAAYFGRELPSTGFAKQFARGVPAPPVFAAVDPIEIVGSGVAGDPHRIVINYDPAEPRPSPTPDLDIDWNNAGTPIEGATAIEYIPLATFALTATVTATNDEGSDGPETSAAVNLKPGYVAAPVLGGYSGVARIGDTLTCPDVTVIGTASSIVKQWHRAGVQVATGGSYLLTDADDFEEVYCRIAITGANGTTFAQSDSVFPIYNAPVVTINDITDIGYTGVTVFECDYEVSGHAEFVTLTWLDYSGTPFPIKNGNSVIFQNAVAKLRCSVIAGNSGGNHEALSDETAVVLQAAAPTITEASISPVGPSVAPGTLLSAVVSATGSPQPTNTVTWKDNGVVRTTAATYVVGASDVGPITFDVVSDNGVDPPDTASSSNSIAVAVDDSPTLGPITIPALNLGEGIYTIDLKQFGTNLTGGAWELTLDDLVATEDVNSDFGEWVFFDYKYLFVDATEWTATGQGQSANPFAGGTITPLPTGFANSEQPGVLRIDEAEPAGTTTIKVWGGDGTSAESVTVTIVLAEPGAATVPPAPTEAHWHPEDNGDGRLAIVVESPFPNGGSVNLDREYEVDDDNDWISFGVTGSGTFPMLASKFTPGVEASVRVRAVNAIGDGDESAAQTETPTVLSGTLDVVDDFPVSAGTMSRTVDIVDDFPVGA